MAELRRQWAGNRRLRLGVFAIAGILALYLFLVLQDWRAALAQEYGARTEHLYKMRALAGQDEWIERARVMAELREALEAEIPEATTPGLAQASVQGWVRDVVSAYGGDSVLVQPQDAVPVPGRPGLWRVPVAISGPLHPDRYLDLVAGIERRQSLSVIEQARVLNRENKTFSMTVVAYFRIPAQEGTPDAGA